MPFKTFVGNTVLQASEVNTYLMRQSVITCTSSTRPSTTATGMTIYETDTGRHMVWTGAAWSPRLNQDVTSTGSPTFSTITASTTVNTANLTVQGAGANRFITINAPSGYYAGQYFAINGVNEWHYEVTPSGLSWSLVESGVAARLTVDTNKMYFNGNNASSPQMEIGDWNTDNRYSAVRTNIGYLLLGATGVNTSIYLRTEAGQGNVYIGAQNTDTLTVTTNSASLAGNMTAYNYLAVSNNYYVTNTTATTGSTDSGNLGYSGANADIAMPWCTGPALGGRTGWAFYSWAANGYRMGFRGTTNNLTRYFWCADWAYFGSTPNDGRVVSGVTVEGDVRTYSSFIATNYLVSTASPTGSGNAAQWLAAFGQYYLVRNTSTRAEKENFAPVGELMTPAMVDEVDIQLWNRKTAPGIPEIGPIADDMDAISPFLSVRGMDMDENGEVYATGVSGINQNSWLSLLTIAVQDLRRRLSQLEAQ